MKKKNFKILNTSTGKVVKSVGAKPLYPRTVKTSNNTVHYSVKRNGPINISFPMIPR